MKRRSANESEQKEKRGAGLCGSNGLIFFWGGIRQETVKAAEDAEPVTITWYREAWHTNIDEKLVEEAINEYIEPLINVKVNILNAAENTDITLALASGEDIDLIWDAAWNHLNTFIQGNSAYDLTEVIDNYPTLKESIPELVWDACKQNGKLWYIPIYKEAGTGSALTVPTVQVEKYGWDLSTVKKAEDIEPMLQDLYEDGAKNPYIAHNFGYLNYYRDTFAPLESTEQLIGIRRDDPSTVINLLETPEYKEYIALLHSWFEKGYINEEEVSDKDNISDEYVAAKRKTGDNGFYIWMQVPDNKAQASSRYGMECEVIPTTKCYIDTDSAAGSALMVNAKTEKIDAVMKFVELLNTDRTLADLAVYGIEGKHYNLVDGKVELIPDSGYSYPGAWIVCNVTTPTPMVGEADDKKKIYDDFNNSLEVSVTNGFRFDSSAVEAEMIALNNVFEEYRTLLNKGVYDPEEYIPKYQEAAKAAGIDKVIAEVQKQWDAFRASQETEASEATTEAAETTTTAETTAE